MKRKIVLILLVLAGLIVAGSLAYLAFYHPGREANPKFANLSQVRAVRVDYLDESKSRSEVIALETQMQQRGTGGLVVLSLERSLGPMGGGHKNERD
jgi:hypothetical protein